MDRITEITPAGMKVHNNGILVLPTRFRVKIIARMWSFPNMFSLVTVLSVNQKTY